MKRVVTYVFFSLAFAISACMTEAGEPPGHGIAGLSDAEPLTYFSLIERDEIDVASQAEWQGIVELAQSIGLTGLPPDARAKLLTVSALAYARSVEQAAYEIVASEERHASVWDVMGVGPTGAYTTIVERRLESEGILVGFPAPPVVLDSAPDEVVALREGEQWERTDGAWTCRAAPEDPAGMLLVHQLYLHIWHVPANGMIVGEDTVRGRTAVAFQGPDDLRVWVDQATYWPIQYQFGKGADAVVVTLTAINMDESIDAPLDIPCSEAESL